MKKIIAITLSLITIIICVWLIVNRIGMLDIASNKKDSWTMWEKRKIDEKTDIPDSEKRILKNELDLKRNHERHISNIAGQTITVALSVIIIQLVLLVFIILMPKKQTKIIDDKNSEQ